MEIHTAGPPGTERDREVQGQEAVMTKPTPSLLHSITIHALKADSSLSRALLNFAICTGKY